MDPAVSTKDPLLQPFRIRNLSLKNRVVSTPHAPAYAEDGKPKLRYQLYHEEKAKGGIGMTMFGGSSFVAPDTPSVFGQIDVSNDAIIQYGGPDIERVVAHVVIEHGTVPTDEIYHACRAHSKNDCVTDIDALLAGRPQALSLNQDGSYMLFRVGDAVNSRNIHAAIYDSLRLCKDL